MPKITSQPPQAETARFEGYPGPMSGDSIIERPDVAWDTPVVVPKSIDDVWSGRFGITRMGAVGDGYAGLLLPQRFDPVLPEHLRSLPVGASEPKRLEVGDSIPDGHPGARSLVVELDDDAKTIVFETRWAGKNKKAGLHYTWQVTASEGDEPGTTNLIARSRMENVKYPKIGRLVHPKLDRFAMNLIREGMMRDDSTPAPKERLRRRIGNKAIVAAGRGIKASKAIRR